MFWVLRDLYRRLFISPPKTPRLSDDAAVRDALRKKLELQSQLRVLRQRAREKQGQEMERKLREESAMLEELKKTRESFGQQIEHIQSEREKNLQMIEERASKSKGGSQTREEKLKRVFEEIEKFEKDFFAPEEPKK